MIPSICSRFFSAPIIGIDLGTTNSCVAVFDPETKKPKVLTNKQGSRTTPSVVALKKGSSNEWLVGQLAQRQAMTAPETTFYSTKRLIGRRFEDPAIQNHNWSFNVTKGPTGDAWIQAGTKKYSPEQIGSQILTCMKEIAQDHLGTEITEAVITVPAYFNDSQRQATKDAGKIAGLDVKRIINEPTAAALSYGIDQTEGKKIAVYDLGGGTFDVSLLEIEDGVFQVTATDGDTFLGGEDFDNSIVEHLLQDIKKQHGVDFSKDQLSIIRLREAAEQTKHALDHASSHTIDLPYLGPQTSPINYSSTITKDSFEKLVQPLIKRSLVPVESCLKSAKISPSDIDHVLMIGGMTRTPAVINAVHDFFGKKPYAGINPDEAVAMGAAIQGGILGGAQMAAGVGDIVLVDVTPLSLGVNTKDDIFSVIIPRNSQIPTKNASTYTTLEDFQSNVTFTVYQGERQIASKNKKLADFNVPIIPAPRGVAKIEVNFALDADGVVNISAQDMATRKPVEMKVQTSGGLSDAQIQAMIKEAEANQEQDAEVARVSTLLGDAERGAYSLEKMIAENESNLTVDQVEPIKKSIAHLKQAISVGARENPAAAESAVEAFKVESEAFYKVIASIQTKDSEK